MKNWEKRKEEFELREAECAKAKLEKKEHKRREKELRKEEEEERQEERKKEDNKRRRDDDEVVEEPSRKVTVAEDAAADEGMEVDGGGRDGGDHRKRKAEDLGDDERVDRGGGEDVDSVEEELAAAWVAEVQAGVDEQLRNWSDGPVKMAEELEMGAWDDVHGGELPIKLVKALSLIHI